VTFAEPGFFGEQSHSHRKRTPKRKLTIFENTKQVIQDYDTVFDNSILRKNDLLRITYFRIPGVPGLHFCALAAEEKRKMVFRGLPRACWEFSFLMGKNMCFDTKVE